MTDSPPPLPEFSAPEPAMDFTSEGDLQRFLLIFLEAKGHTVYREVQCENGGRIDLLTSLYLIECKRYLTRSALHSAAGQLWVYRQRYSDRQPIIAGLTPKANQEDAFAAAAKLKEAGIQIWFVDHMAEILEFYEQMPAPVDPNAPDWVDSETNPEISPDNDNETETETETDMSPANADELPYAAEPAGLAAPVAAPLVDNRPRRSPSAISFEAGCGALIGAGIVLAGFLMVARVFRANPPVQLSYTEQQHWTDLHAAIPAWDIETAKTTLSPLMQSKDPCVMSFARSLNDSLNAEGPEGFRQVNTLKRALNDAEGCQLAVTPYEFAP